MVRFVLPYFVCFEESVNSFYAVPQLVATTPDYLAYLAREKLDGKMYKMTDRSLYGARAPFVKVYRKGKPLSALVPLLLLYVRVEMLSRPCLFG